MEWKGKAYLGNKAMEFYIFGKYSDTYVHPYAGFIIMRIYKFLGFVIHSGELIHCLCRLYELVKCIQTYMPLQNH